MKTRHIAIAGLVLFQLLRGFWLLHVIPPWQGPDEPMHFLLAVAPASSSLDETSRVSIERAVIASMALNDFWELTGQVEPDPLPQLLRTFRSAPPATLYHRLLGGWLHVTGFRPEDVTNTDSRNPLASALRAGRMLSVLFGAGSVLLLGLFCGQVMSCGMFSLLAPAMLVAQPQLSFIGSCLNSDNMILLIACVVLYLLAQLQRGLRRRATYIFLIFLAIVAPVAKRAGFVVTASVLLALLSDAGLRKKSRVILGSMAIGVPMLAALWLLGLGRSMLIDLAETLGVGGWVGEPPPLWWTSFIEHFWSTFWGNYGWVQCPFDSIWYKGIAIVFIATIALIPRGYRVAWRGGRMLLWIIALQPVAAVIQVLVGLGARFELAQGRHAFVALPGLFVLCALGIRGAFGSKVSPLVWPAISLLVIGLQELATWFVMVPCFLR